MIKLINLLRETKQGPKAIFLAGPAGAGKSFISKQIILSGKFNVINSDDTYEELLKASGLGMKQKDFGPEELSQAAKLQAQAQKATKEKYSQALENRHDIIIDGTGAASGPLLKKKAELEELGYTTFMVMIYVSPMTSLERNADRDRSLMPAIVLRTWRDVNKNIQTYEQAFGDNFILLNNDPAGADKSFDPAIVKRRFFDTSTGKGKEKTPEEMMKRAQEAADLNQSITDILKSEPEAIDIGQAKAKIQAFIG
jgi:dephospho-CoA kinase